jgi:hypothetical protein
MSWHNFYTKEKTQALLMIEDDRGCIFLSLHLFCFAGNFMPTVHGRQ